MKIKGNLMICGKNKPAYPLISNVKITTSVENAEHKKWGQSIQTYRNKFFNGKQAIVKLNISCRHQNY